MREHDQPVHRLDGPTLFDEAMREPVEQFRMSGLFAAGTKIIWRLHDAFAEMEFPNAIDHHAGSQRVGRISQPTGELSAAASLLFRRHGLPAEDREESARDFFTERTRFALL